MLPAASFVLTSHTVLLPSVGAPCILPVLTIVNATQLLEPHITERELPSRRLFSETMFVIFNTAPHTLTGDYSQVHLKFVVIYKKPTMKAQF